METVIIGAGGFAKEIAFLLESHPEYDLVGFVDDSEQMQNKEVIGKPILGKTSILLEIEKETAIFIGIASPKIKEKFYILSKKNQHLHFPNLIASSALVGINIQMGIGNILMPYTTYTADIVLGDFNMINISSTIGHDAKIGNYNAIYPNVNISGYTRIGDKNEIGVGTKIIPQVKIGNETIIGAGSVVIEDIEDCTKNVGVPAKMIESWG